MVKLKPELSKKNKYWVDKNRYYELKYFCLQYPLWKRAYEELDGIHTSSFELVRKRTYDVVKAKKEQQVIDITVETKEASRE